MPPLDYQNLAYAFLLGTMAGIFIRVMVHWLALLIILGGLLVQLGHVLGWFRTDWFNPEPFLRALGQVRWEQLSPAAKILIAGGPWTLALFLGMLFGYLVFRRW